jgi:hypothetical protein
VNGATVTSQDEAADMLLSFFESALNSVSYALAFLQLKAHEESHHLSFTTGGTEPYNSPFSVAKLESALICPHDTSSGPDTVQNQMLRHLPPSVLVFLLNMYSCIWSDASFPS